MTDDQELWQFTHLVDLTRAVRGIGPLTPNVWVVDCWGHPVFDLPDWAVQAAANNEHPSHWCPHLAAKPPVED